MAILRRPSDTMYTSLIKYCRVQGHTPAAPIGFWFMQPRKSYKLYVKRIWTLCIIVLRAQLWCLTLSCLRFTHSLCKFCPKIHLKIVKQFSGHCHAIKSLQSAQLVSRKSSHWPLKLMMSQAVEGTWIRTGGYGGKWVKRILKKPLFVL